MNDFFKKEWRYIKIWILLLIVLIVFLFTEIKQDTYRARNNERFNNEVKIVK